MCGDPSRWNIEYCVATCAAVFSKAVDTTCISNKCRASEFRVGVEFQGVLDNVTSAICTFTRAKNEAAMWNAFVVAIKFFLRNEVYYSFITYEVVFHSFDFIFNFSFVRIRSSYYVALTKVTFVAINVWSFTIADSFKVLKLCLVYLLTLWKIFLISKVKSM